MQRIRKETSTKDAQPRCTKEPYKKRREALDALSRIKGKHGREANATLEPYRCRTCGCWHLGNKPSTPEEHVEQQCYGGTMRWIELPNQKAYHIVKEGETPRPLCTCLASRNDWIPLIVTTRSEGRRMCKECYKTARYAKLKLPPRTEWERQQWNEERP